MLNEFLFTKIDEGDIGHIWFKQDGPMQPKLLTMFCALFLKIVLSAAELMSTTFDHLEAAMTPLDYYLWFAVKDKCYADKPRTTL